MIPVSNIFAQRATQGLPAQGTMRPQMPQQVPGGLPAQGTMRPQPVMQAPGMAQGAPMMGTMQRAPVQIGQMPNQIPVQQPGSFAQSPMVQNFMRKRLGMM